MFNEGEIVLKLYVGFIKNSVQRVITYRTNVWAKTLGKFLYLYVQVSVWIALYESNNISQNMRGLQQIILYVVINNLLSCLVEFNAIDLLNQKIKTGDIALDLMKPFNYMLYIFCYGLGDIIINVCFQAVPMLLFSMIFWGFSIAEYSLILIFICSAMLSIVISFLFAYFIGILAFWFLVTWPINMATRAIYKIMSGVWIPIWLFPGFLKKISLCLPFQSIYYAPAFILSQPVLDKVETIRLIEGQFVWIVIMGGIVNVAWHCGRKKLVIQGG